MYIHSLFLNCLLIGNINSAVDSVVTLAELRREGSNAETVALSEEEMVSVTTTVSNLITVKNNDSWSKILRVCRHVFLNVSQSLIA